MTDRALEPREIAAILRGMARTVEAELLSLPREVASWHPAPGEWCALEAVGHLIESERHGFAGRIREVLAGKERLDTWDQEEVERARHDCDRDPADLVREFAAAREESARMVEGLRPEDLGKGGEHVDIGVLTVDDLLHEWVHHDRNHVKQMMSAVQSRVWP